MGKKVSKEVWLEYLAGKREYEEASPEEKIVMLEGQVQRLKNRLAEINDESNKYLSEKLKFERENKHLESRLLKFLTRDGEPWSKLEAFMDMDDKDTVDDLLARLVLRKKEADSGELQVNKVGI